MSIISVTVYGRYRKRDTTSYPFTGRSRLGFQTYATDYYGDHIFPYATNYYDYSDTWTTNPNTGNPWIQDEIDALAVYHAIQGNDASGYQSGGHGTQVYVLVAYSSGNVIKRPVSTVVSDANFDWDNVDEETPDEDASYDFNYGTTGGATWRRGVYALSVVAPPWIPKVFII